MKDKFIKFLKEENVYYRFRSYFTFDTLNDNLELYLNETNPEDYVTIFDWNDTDEGWDFWNALNYKWKKLMNEEYEYIITFKGKDVSIALLHQDIKRLLCGNVYKIGETNVKITRNKIQQ